jgi:hypothetical protein
VVLEVQIMKDDKSSTSKKETRKVRPERFGFLQEDVVFTLADGTVIDRGKTRKVDPEE